MQQLSLTPQPKKTVVTPEDDQGLTSPQPDVLSISDLNALIRESLETGFAQIWVQGEVSNFKAHSSGHWYFSLKDAKSQISAVMFKGLNSKVKFRPEDGMELLIRGRVTVYEPRGSYQIFCEGMEPQGSGALQKAFEQLKLQLEKEGLFDKARKRSLPKYPQQIAIVTSPTGAAIRDMIHVLSRRQPNLKVTLVPAVVQGDAAPDSICQAIELSKTIQEAEVLIVGRGGGSIEDLWAFNSEAVARKIAEHPIPVISAVGHEVDFTIADFVADVRAPTPSAAAEIVVQSVEETSATLNHWLHRLVQGLQQRFKWQRGMITTLEKALVDPRRHLINQIQRCDDLSTRLEVAMGQNLKRQRVMVAHLSQRVASPLSHIKAYLKTLHFLSQSLQKSMDVRLTARRSSLSEMMTLLDSLSPLQVMHRGYGILFKNKNIVKTSQDLNLGDSVEYRMVDGEVRLEVKQVNSKEVSV